MAIALYWAVSTGMWDAVNKPTTLEKQRRQTATQPRQSHHLPLQTRHPTNPAMPPETLEIPPALESLGKLTRGEDRVGKGLFFEVALSYMAVTGAWEMKRVIDIGTAAILLCLTAPIMLVSAVCIRSGNDGPILFRQTRVGRFGRNFEILKFRTMRTVVQLDGITVGKDARITRAGRILRRSKIDELPQLLNVLKGDMSLVGPRPEIPEYYALYPVEDRTIISSIRPGITDRASIIYRNEAELLAEQADPYRYYRDVILPHKISIGAEYARTQNIMGDFKILIDTVRAVLAGGSE